MFIKNHKKKAKQNHTKRRKEMYMKKTCILSKLENYVSCVEKWKSIRNLLAKKVTLCEHIHDELSLLQL